MVNEFFLVLTMFSLMAVNLTADPHPVAPEVHYHGCVSIQE